MNQDAPQNYFFHTLIYETGMEMKQFLIYEIVFYMNGMQGNKIIN